MGGQDAHSPARGLLAALDAAAGRRCARARGQRECRGQKGGHAAHGLPADRLPLAPLFDEVRVRAGVFDDDPPSVARRKLLAWVQALMPDRPDRASQVAHLLGLYTGVEFPDSPHLSHARAVPEVARMAAGAALVDALRGVAGRSLLVLLVERVELCTETEVTFLRRLLRQLGATPVLVVAGWLAFEFVPNEVDTALGTFNAWQMFFFFTAAMLFINIHHYFLDNVLWRFKDPQVRQYLLG